MCSRRWVATAARRRAWCDRATPEAVAAFGLTDGRRAQVVVANLRAVETSVLMPGERTPMSLDPHAVLLRDLGRSLAAR